MQCELITFKHTMWGFCFISVDLSDVNKLQDKVEHKWF